MFSRLLVGFALLTPVVGIRKNKRGNANVTLSSSDDERCNALADIVIGGRAFGEGFDLMCRHWPERFGEFPIDDVERARELVNKAIEPGGTWDRIKEIRAARGNRGFCWRNDTLRTKVESNCVMEVRDVCYGACPTGYKPGFLSGVFGPACTTACSASSHSKPCGFGCATTWGNCARTILDQAASVASGVGEVFSFVTGDDRISQVADAVVTFAEFILSVLPTLIDAVKGAIDIVKSNEEGIMVLTVLYEYIQEIAPELGTTAQEIKIAFEKMADLITAAIQTRQEEGSISVSKTIRGILDQGEWGLEHAKVLVKAFSFDKCAPDAAIEFVVENVGEEKFVGPYVKRGTSNGKPYYSLNTNTKLRVEWDADRGSGESWQFVEHRTWSRNSFLYESVFPTTEYAVSGWTTLSGPEPLPEIVAMKPRSEEDLVWDTKEV